MTPPNRTALMLLLLSAVLILFLILFVGLLEAAVFAGGWLLGQKA